MSVNRFRSSSLYPARRHSAATSGRPGAEPPQGKAEDMGVIRKFLRDESGATAIEYGLIAALVAVAIIVAVDALGVSVGSLFSGVSDKVTAKLPK